MNRREFIRFAKRIKENYEGHWNCINGSDAPFFVSEVDIDEREPKFRLIGYGFCGPDNSWHSQEDLKSTDDQWYYMCDEVSFGICLNPEKELFKEFKRRDLFNCEIVDKLGRRKFVTNDNTYSCNQMRRTFSVGGLIVMENGEWCQRVEENVTTDNQVQKTEVDSDVLPIPRWYVDEDKTSYIFRKGNNNNYGFVFGEYIPSGLYCSDPSCWIPADIEEVKELFRKEAVKKGFKKGAKYRDIQDKEIYTCEEEFKFVDGKLMCTVGGGWIFSKGKWAEIVKTCNADTPAPVNDDCESGINCAKELDIKLSNEGVRNITLGQAKTFDTFSIAKRIQEIELEDSIKRFQDAAYRSIQNMRIAPTSAINFEGFMHLFDKGESKQEHESEIKGKININISQKVKPSLDLSVKEVKKINL